MKYIAYSIISILIFSSGMLSWEKFGLKEHVYVSQNVYPSDSNCEITIDLDDFEYYSDFTDYMNKKMHYDYNVTLEFQVENHRYRIIPVKNFRPNVGTIYCGIRTPKISISNEFIVDYDFTIINQKNSFQEKEVQELFLNQYNPIDAYGDFNSKRLSTILDIQLSKNSKIDLLKQRILLAISEYENVKKHFPKAQFNMQIGFHYPEVPPPGVIP